MSIFYDSQNIFILMLHSSYHLTAILFTNWVSKQQIKVTPSTLQLVVVAARLCHDVIIFLSRPELCNAYWRTRILLIKDGTFFEEHAVFLLLYTWEEIMVAFAQ